MIRGLVQIVPQCTVFAVFSVRTAPHESDANAQIHSLTRPLTHSLTHSLTDSLNHSLTHPFIHSLTNSPIHIHSLTHLFTHPSIHSPTHSLTLFADFDVDNDLVLKNITQLGLLLFMWQVGCRGGIVWTRLELLLVPLSLPLFLIDSF